MMILSETTINSKVLGMDTSFYALIPDRKPINRMGHREPIDRPYPVLYLLHGLGDDHRAWLRLSRIEQFAEKHQVAVMMPHAHNSFYTDMRHGFRFFTYMTEELPAVVKSLYPISDRREDTYICGVSMGGYGAFKIALTYPERYAAAAAISGPLDMVERVKQRMPVFDLVFGDADVDLRGSEHDLLHLSSALIDSGQAAPRLYQCCGTEDHLYRYNESFHAHAEIIKLPHGWSAQTGGHNWAYFDQKLGDVYEWMFMD